MTSAVSQKARLQTWAQQRPISPPPLPLPPPPPSPLARPAAMRLPSGAYTRSAPLRSSTASRPLSAARARMGAVRPLASAVMAAPPRRGAPWPDRERARPVPVLKGVEGEEGVGAEEGVENAPPPPPPPPPPPLLLLPPPPPPMPPPPPASPRAASPSHQSQPAAAMYSEDRGGTGAKSAAEALTCKGGCCAPGIMAGSLASSSLRATPAPPTASNSSLSSSSQGLPSAIALSMSLSASAATRQAEGAGGACTKQRSTRVRRALAEGAKPGALLRHALRMCTSMRATCSEAAFAGRSG